MYTLVFWTFFAASALPQVPRGAVQLNSTSMQVHTLKFATLEACQAAAQSMNGDRPLRLPNATGGYEVQSQCVANGKAAPAAPKP